MQPPSHLLPLGLAILTLTACAHAWVEKRAGNTAQIGYASPGFFANRKDIRKEFNDIAKTICKKKKKVVVVRELVPLPAIGDTLNTLQRAKSGDASGTVESGSRQVAVDIIHRANVLHRDASIEYNHPLKNTHACEIKCQ